MLQVILLCFEKCGGVILDGNRVDFVALSDLIHGILSRDHLAEDRMFAVKVRGWQVGDKELAAIGVRSGICHGENARLFVFERAVDLVGKLITRAAGACASRVAALDHEIGDHAMKADAIIVSALGEVEKIRGGDWDLRSEDSRVDVASGGVKCDFDVRHGRQIIPEFRVWQLKRLQSPIDIHRRSAPPPGAGVRRGGRPMCRFRFRSADRRPGFSCAK